MHGFKKMLNITKNCRGRTDPTFHSFIFTSTRLAHSLGVANETLFLPSLREGTKIRLLQSCTALLYTPINEHFGITPLEAMAAGRPVISCDSGGPCETVLSGKTGLLVAKTPQVRTGYHVLLTIFSIVSWKAFANAMFSLYQDRSQSRTLGRSARTRVQEMYSFECFTTKLNTLIHAAGTSWSSARPVESSCTLLYKTPH